VSELDRADLLESTSDARATRLLEIAARTMVTGMVIVEAPSGRILFRNSETDWMFGPATSEIQSTDEYDRVVAFDQRGQRVTNERWPIARALTGEVTVGEQIEVERENGERRTVSVNASPVRDPNGEIIAAVATYFDITDAKRASDASKFIAAVGAVLDTFDPSTSLQAIVDLAVPVLADWCFIHLASPEGVHTAAIAHGDPQELARVRARLAKPHVLSPNTGIARVLAGGPRELIQIDDEVVRQAALDEAHYEEMRASGYRSCVIAPLTGCDGIFGTVTFAMSHSGRRYDERDLDTLAELARRVGTALDNARLFERARIADRRKDEFLAMLGHELRNPLAPIATALQLMDMKDSTSMRKERDVLRRQVDHLSSLIDDLLDMSRVTRGKIQLARRVTEIGSVVARAVEMASPLLEKRTQRLTIDVPSTGLLVDADPTRLAQVFQNLLTNAAKYSEPGSVVELTARGEGDHVIVEVRDQGVGIPGELLPHLFDLFVQGERSLDRAEGGLGIGLTIARSLCELHGGTITATSAGVGRGSTFTVTLPRAARDATTAEAAEPQRLAIPLLAGARVLVVDDNVDAAEMLREFLTALGHESVVAHDGPSALALATTFKPEVALLDLGLPVMNGFELARRLREHLGPDQVRLIAITGYGQEADHARAQEVGFEDHLMKPIELAALLPLLAK
jgi:PAS domain S-box-containing protein